MVAEFEWNSGLPSVEKCTDLHLFLKLNIGHRQGFSGLTQKIVVGLSVSRPSRGGQPPQRGVRLHDYARHTFASMQLSAGVHFMQVSQWLGHAHYSLTLDTYGDWIPSEDGGAGNQLPEPSAPPTPISVAAEPVPSNVVPLFGRRSS